MSIRTSFTPDYVRYEGVRLNILYSTSWSNDPSLAVARKLGLKACASDWRLTA